MTHLRLTSFIFLAFYLLSCTSFTRPPVETDRIILSEKMTSYRILAPKDFDLMKEQVIAYRDEALKYIDQSDYDKDVTNNVSAIRPLYEGMRFIFSRPDRDDNMVAKLVPFIRFELTHIGYYQTVLTDLAREAIAGIQYEKLDIQRRATYYFVLENLIGEIKPDLKRKPRIKKIFERIRDAKIDMTKELKSELLLNTMLTPTSPSFVAEKILETYFPSK